MCHAPIMLLNTCCVAQVYLPGPAIVGEDALGRHPLNATLAATPAGVPARTLYPAVVAGTNGSAVTTSNDVSIGDAAANIAFANVSGDFGIVDALTDQGEAARIAHLQPWVGVDVESMCLPNVLENIPSFNDGTY